MGFQSLGKNIPALPGQFDANNSNSLPPTPGQLSVGFTPNVDLVQAEQQNYMHGASMAALYLMQKLGLPLPFNPDANGHSIVSCPSGGIVAIQQTGGNTEFYNCINPAGMAAGFSDPSLDPTNWALINFRAIATYTTPYADATGTADVITASYPSVIYPVLNDGFTLMVGIAASNLTTTPTFAASLNGGAATAITIKKRAPNGANIPLATGDLFGTVTLEYDKPNNVWILDNPPGQQVQPGSLVVYAGPTPPPGVLQLPPSATNISRAAYPALFAAIGTTWGAGDGSTTFGMPYLPPGYSILNYVGLGALAAQTAGQPINHVHTVPGVGNGTSGTGVPPPIPSNGIVGGLTYSTNNPTTGGAANLPAGVLFNIGIKY